MNLRVTNHKAKVSSSPGMVTSLRVNSNMAKFIMVRGNGMKATARSYFVSLNRVPSYEF